MSPNLTDNTLLPGFWKDADAASLRGQGLTVFLSRVRLTGAVLAAVGGALTWSAGWFNVWAGLALVGFVAALIAELVLLVQQPERDWYAGRALAESAKTLAWRYAVAGDPFLPTLQVNKAREIMRDRLGAVAAQGHDRVTISPGSPCTTPAMEALRSAPFAERRRAYIGGRTETQHRWYVEHAETNKKRVFIWRVLLLAAETVAIVLAAGRAFGRWDIDWSGVLAAFVATGAAWMGLKQYSPLASAYSIAAAELALQAGRLKDTSEEAWPMAVSDAEEAISREHTMWLASRSGGAIRVAAPRIEQAPPDTPVETRGGPA
ncbi:DUF4231 domain-containing protein [soil metagenome]